MNLFSYVYLLFPFVFLASSLGASLDRVEGFLSLEGLFIFKKPLVEPSKDCYFPFKKRPPLKRLCGSNSFFDEFVSGLKKIACETKVVFWIKSGSRKSEKFFGFRSINEPGIGEEEFLEKDVAGLVVNIVMVVPPKLDSLAVRSQYAQKILDLRRSFGPVCVAEGFCWRTEEDSQFYKLFSMAERARLST